MSFDFQNMPIVNNYGVPMNPNGNMYPYATQQQQMNQQQIMEQQNMQRMANVQMPKITANSEVKLNLIKNDDSTTIHVDPDVPDMEKERKRRGRPRKSDNDSTSTGIIRADSSTPEKVTGEVEDTPTAYSYMETTNMLRETLGQIDSLNAELMQEFNTVRHSRTMKNKYNTLVGLSENVGSLINNKISAIREINSAISKANDLDYKKLKDRKAAEAGVDDDKYIADLYKSVMQNPQYNAPAPQLPQVDPSLFGSGIVRADIKSGDINSNGPVDAGYLNYMSNLSPEQNMMMYESNPNVKQVVVFDASTGNKFFQVMDMSTGQVIPNVPVYDQMFMEDTTLDLKTKIAKNINLNETFPIVVINEGATSQY